MAPAPKPKKSVWKRIVGWFKDRVEWIEAHGSDSAITRTLLEDLGLPPSTPMTPPEEIPEDKKKTIDGYLAQVDPDELALGETLLAFQDIYETSRVFYESLKDQNITAWELFWLITQIWVVEMLRVRNPAGYFVAKALGGITGEYDTVEHFDPAIVVSTLKGEPPPPGYGEQFAQRWSALFGVAAVVIGHWRREATHGTTMFEAFYGWDPDPDSASPMADLASQRTGTIVLRFRDTPEIAVGITATAVTTAQGGPGLFVAVSGELSVTQVEGELSVTASFAAPAGAWFYIPWVDSAMPFTAGGPAEAFVRATIRQAPLNEPGTPPPSPGTPLPPLDIAITDGTRLELAGLELVIDVRKSGAGIRGFVSEGRLILSFEDGDGFLAKLPGKRVEVPFSVGISLDTTNGLRIEGGTRLRASLPVSASLYGVFTLQYLELSTGPSPTDGIALELSAGMSLNLGPFRASVDRVGILLDSGGVPEDDFLALSKVVAFKLPSGIGLVIDAEAVKGGGYLYIDPVRGEYAGVLELEMNLPVVGRISLKAIGLLSTKLPDGREGWALLLLIYAQFRAQLGYGFTFNGLGGIVGLHHQPDTAALSDGLRGAVLDDILFPENPVADAPRIIPRLRTVFPIEVDTFTIGPAIELGWGTPTLVQLRVALLFERENALGGADPAHTSKIVVLGQLLVQVPSKDLGVPPIVRLLIDVLGWYDYDEEWLFFRARLRDSKVVGFALTGELVVSVESGDEPTMIVAAGGFHPLFVDVPRGVPATLDRLGFGFKLGRITLEVKLYYAVTPNARHIGLNIELKAKLGPVSIEGYVGFDALVDTETDRFRAQVRFGVALKYKGHSLCGVKVDMVLDGPDSWHAVGTGTFEILWWDVDFDFDERWGDPETISTVTIPLREQVAAELSVPANWSARLPAGLAPPITVEMPETGIVVHPLGELDFLQRTAPFGIAVSRVGAKRVAGGPVTFSLPAATIGGRPASVSAVREHFARGQFVDLSEEAKLTTPAFERFDAGTSVGVTGFRVPGSSGLGRAPLSFEDRYLVPEDEPQPDPDPRRTVLDHRIPRDPRPASGRRRAPAGQGRAGGQVATKSRVAHRGDDGAAGERPGRAPDRRRRHAAATAGRRSGGTGFLHRRRTGRSGASGQRPRRAVRARGGGLTCPTPGTPSCPGRAAGSWPSSGTPTARHRSTRGRSCESGRPSRAPVMAAST